MFLPVTEILLHSNISSFFIYYDFFYIQVCFDFHCHCSIHHSCHKVSSGHCPQNNYTETLYEYEIILNNSRHTYVLNYEYERNVFLHIHTIETVGTYL